MVVFGLGGAGNCGERLAVPAIKDLRCSFGQGVFKGYGLRNNHVCNGGCGKRIQRKKGVDVNMVGLFLFIQEIDLVEEGMVYEMVVPVLGMW